MLNDRMGNWIRPMVFVASCAASLGAVGCGHSGDQPAPQTPETQPVPPDSPLAQIKPDMSPGAVASVLGEPYKRDEYSTGKQFIPGYNAWGGDQFRVAWFYRGLGRVIFSRHSAYDSNMHVVKTEYDPTEGGGPPPAPPAPAADANAAAPAPADASQPPAEDYADNDPVALTDFHGALDAHGQWVDDPTYGTIWVPAAAEVGAEFTPYATSGHWVQDDDQWVWVSDYDWGWAPFHYGRWVFVDGRGWSWIPGREYAGAWVDWQVGDDGYGYVGWAPAPPAFVWIHGAPVSFEVHPEPRYVFVRREDVFAPTVGRRVLAPSVAITVRARMHPYAPEAGRRGPAPERLGFKADRVPHSSNADKAKMSKAHEFSKPSTAQAAGGHPPTRTAANRTAGPGAGHGPEGTRPGEQRGPSNQARPGPENRAEESRPSEHAAGPGNGNMNRAAGPASQHAAPGPHPTAHSAPPRHR